MIRGSSAARAPRFSSAASAAEPMPVEARPRNVRRVMTREYFSKMSIASLSRDRFVEVQDRAGDRRPGGQLGGIDVLRGRRLAHGQRLIRRLGVRLELI